MFPSETHLDHAPHESVCVLPENGALGPEDMDEAEAYKISAIVFAIEFDDSRWHIHLCDHYSNEAPSNQKWRLG